MKNVVHHWIHWILCSCSGVHKQALYCSFCQNRYTRLINLKLFIVCIIKENSSWTQIELPKIRQTHATQQKNEKSNINGCRKVFNYDFQFCDHVWRREIMKQFCVVLPERSTSQTSFKAALLVPFTFNISVLHAQVETYVLLLLTIVILWLYTCELMTL